VSMAEEVEDPLVGKILNGKYQILAPLGTGGMGRVYKALQQPLDRVVALKVLNPKYDSAKDPGFEKRFFLEANATAKLKHPNTVTVHDYGRTDDGLLYIAMEYVEGETLAQLVQREGPLPWARALYVAAQVARSLREAHKLGLVHRDLKPANVMLMQESTTGDVVKVLDFGLVKPFSTGLPRPGETELTQAGVLMGSPLYMAPEQARNEADQRTDIYSLGILLFQLIAGRPPFQGKEAIDIIVRHIKEAPPTLRSQVPDVPLEVDALVAKCLEKDPFKRFQMMDEVLDAMRAATAGQGLSGVFADPRTTSGQMPRVSAPHGLRPLTGAQSIPISVDDRDVTESASVKAERSSKRTFIAVAAVLAVAGVGFGVYLAVRLSKPDVTPPKVVTPTDPPKTDPKTPPKVDPTPTPQPVKVVFEVTSQPAGATVSRDGKVLGTTPLSFTVERAGEAPAGATLAFSLDGYFDATQDVSGHEGTVAVSQSLKKKPAPKVGKRPKGNKKNPDGYKDDPYQ
jgi:serine/threonine protein kinase